MEEGGAMMDDRDRRTIETVRRAYQAEREAMAPDIVWHVPGHNPVSGVYRGAREYFELMPSRMAPLTRWEFVLGDIMVNGDHVVATFSLTGERKGVSVDLRGCHIFRLDEQGQIAEGWGFTNDQEALDAFFSA
jgi:ketosteroid isomerase-like protein